MYACARVCVVGYGWLVNSIECAGKLEEAIDRLKKETNQRKEVEVKEKATTNEARKLQRRFDDMSLARLADQKALEGCATRCKELEDKLAKADEQVFT